MNEVQLNEGADVVAVDPSWIKTETEEVIPCGIGVYTWYKDAAGNVMRQDYTVKVSPDALKMGGSAQLPT